MPILAVNHDKSLLDVPPRRRQLVHSGYSDGGRLGRLRGSSDNRTLSFFALLRSEPKPWLWQPGPSQLG